jgi:hypothetical protein
MAGFAPYRQQRLRSSFLSRVIAVPRKVSLDLSRSKAPMAHLLYLRDVSDVSLSLHKGVCAWINVTLFSNWQPVERIPNRPAIGDFRKTVVERNPYLGIGQPASSLRKAAGGSTSPHSTLEGRPGKEVSHGNTIQNQFLAHRSS